MRLLLGDRGHRMGWLLAGLVGLSGCAGREVLSLPGLPEDLVYAALLGLDRDGAVVAASNFAARTGERFEFRVTEDEPPVRYRVFGWRPADLQGFEPLRDLQPDLSAIGIAGSEDPILPGSSYAAVGEREASTLQADLDPVPELTAPWLPRCPRAFEVAPSLLGDFQCIRTRCEFSFDQRECHFEIETGTCRIGPLTGAIDGRGRFDFDELGPQLGSCIDRGAARSPAAYSFDCELDGYGCALDLYAPAAGPAIDLQRVDLGEVGSSDELNVLILPPKGVLGGLAVLPDRLVVARYGAPVAGLLCNLVEPSELVFLDKETLAVTRTSTAPPCLERLASAPTGDGFFGVFEIAGVHHLARFDSDGEVQRNVVIPSPPLVVEAMTTDNAVRSISVYENRVFLSWSLSDVVFAFDATSLAQLWSTEAMGARPKTDLLVTDDGVVMSDRSDRLYFIDPDEGSFIRPTNVTQVCRAGVFEPANLSYQPTRRRYVFLNRDVSAEVYTLNQERTSCASAVYFEGIGEAYDAALVPDDPGSLWVALWDDATKEAALSLLELDQPRFQPGSIRWPASGPPWDLQSDGEAVYGLIPWNGHVFRATRRRD